MDESERAEALASISYEIAEFSRGDIIYSPSSFEKKIGFILRGECEIGHLNSDGKIILNTLKESDSFGIMAVFKDEPFPTEVYAKKNTSVLFIDQAGLISLIERSGKIAMNIIKFLAERVSFLNKRIDTVTKMSVEKKFASYIISKAKAAGSTSIPFNFKKCSETIGAGRASVYRSLESLKNRGYIAAENKIIKILDINSMEDFLK